MRADLIDVDALAQEIRRVDGNNSLGAGALAEALMPFLADALASQEPVAWRWRMKGTVCWIYDPTPEWLSTFGRRDNLEIEPLFASPVVPVAAKAEAEGWRDMKTAPKDGQP